MRPLERILVVEDDPDIQTVIELCLRRFGGYMVQVCGAPQEAVGAAESFGPDLILLDVMMPGMDGLETLEMLRQTEATARIPVIFMTAKVRPHEIERYTELGALGVVAKPFEPDGLAETVRSLWERAHA
jgi:two-component system, OmpR family, response regulator